MAALTTQQIDALTDDELLTELLGDAVPIANDITKLVHVKPKAMRKQVAEVAKQVPCKDFECFKGIFNNAQRGLKGFTKEAIQYRDGTSINQGDLFILNGLYAYVAVCGIRLRVIYSNGTESDLLLLSLQRALYKDINSKRVI